MEGKTYMKKKILVISLFLLIVISACSYRPGPSVEEMPFNVETQKAMIEEAVRGTATASAMQTQISVLETEVALPTTAAMTQAAATATPEPPTPTTPPPTATPVPPTPTATQVPPTATPVTPTATNTPSVPCNQAKFEGDITIPDGTIFAPGTSFTKTWRLRNSGSCTWTNAYDLVFYKGDQMSAPAAVDFTGNVAPGQTVDLSVNLVAPGNPGHYKGNWKLKDASGVLFGLGKQDAPFYVDIKVETTAGGLPFDMVKMMCSAEWTSGAGKLPCPGKDNDSAGFVLRIDNPVLESGYVDNEPVLLTHPQMVNDGVIRGKYPAIRVENGYRFSSVIGCANKATGCDVNFQLDYQIGNGSITTLVTWHEIYDEKFAPVSVDLSSLAGKDVRFILTVLSNGSPTNDRAQWLAPKISK